VAPSAPRRGAASMPGLAVLVSTRIERQRRHVITASTHQCFPRAGTTASCQRSTAGEEISGELAAVLDLSESTVSHHFEPAAQGRSGHLGSAGG
jgi:hypothetical protein